jgi:two-component system, OmpR family, KDP operon response regulator KdpE
MRVLVVEDDRSVRETLGIVLETYGYQPDLADSGEKALEHLRLSWPDVMLLDLTLTGMSGEEFYRVALKEFETVPPTVVLSAVQHGEDRLKDMPGARFLAKPYTLEQLIEAIREAARTRAA